MTGRYEHRPFFKWLFVFAIAGAVSACDSGGSDREPRNDGAGDLPPVTFVASRVLINEGESTRLRWSSPTADSIEIEPGIGSVDPEGERLVTPAETTEYVLTARLDNDVNVTPLTVTVRPLAAVRLVANVLEGDAPLAVRFTPRVDSLTAINRFYWDFEGDGGPVDGGLGIEAAGFDQLRFPGGFEVTGRDQTFTFDVPGTYETRVRVWDVEGNQADSTLTVLVGNAPPEALVRVSPTRATAPLDANFTVVASDNEGIASYEWDFEGDGVYDETSERGTIRHRYETPGRFTPQIRVTDSLGMSVELNPLHLQVDARLENVPTVTVTARPAVGVAPLEVAMSARVSSPDRSPIASWAWDFDGDGVTDSAEPSPTSHVYTRIGTFYPTLTVTTENGSVGRDIFDIIVEPDVALSVANAAPDPEQGESATVTVAVNGALEMRVDVEDAAGTRVRVLSEYATFDADDHPFPWNGQDTSGRVLPPGDYYAVVRYRVDGIERVLDLRTSTGGEYFYPSGWGGGTCYSARRDLECGVLTVSDNEIEPFADQPLVYAFSIPYNARVTGYVTIIGGEDFAPATFFRSRLLARGDYAIEWFGEGTDGKFLPRRDRGGYLPAIYGLTTSDNAVVLSHATSIDSLTATPGIFYPPLAPVAEGASGGGTLAFDLSRASDIVLTVDNTEAGAEVLRREYPGVPAGSGVTLKWDGRDNGGQLLAPGGYRISLYARDAFGQLSLPTRAMQRIRY